MTKILVTGGAGFIGSNCIHYLLNKYEDIEIVNYDVLSYGSNLENLRDVEKDKRYKFIKGDIADREKLEEVIKSEEIAYIINFAAETHVDRSISSPLSFINTNVVGVATLLEMARKYDIDRLVHISTDEVYGDIVEGSFKEGDRLSPSSPYSASKASADLIVKSYVRTYGIDAVITRCSNNYGPYQFPEKLIPKTIIRALKGLKIPVYGTGKQVRDWIFVEDHCRGIDLVLQKGSKGEIYNIASNEEKENIEVVRKILAYLGKNEDMIEYVEDRPGHDVRYSLNTEKIRNLGWKPVYNFDEGLKYVVEWYVKNEWWWKPLINDKVLHPTPWKLKW
ncbi:dTDP-glucose 4,6-dehydratase [Candidatus Aciduliprofundum boonei]|uniref:dTDP-glucose 4,6-dehydratase n=1 Tax=Aciduliprofundum boonei (strain DSM 19572 / T469) TaxID=439481 RepID=B5IDJ3_ACIB4|nr:dTDP-glucose 4,6-dehydratase [Candidatus Aciduliprofundum boonei]ADD08068.1 dTDP-glucose 4,6-dehydratase [Aciduliprofundum boonei T469]EDY35668.1 dTDP-glucose 4,6-dehydratase [Aciduliprofundum boonei T469]